MTQRYNCLCIKDSGERISCTSNIRDRERFSWCYYPEEMYILISGSLLVRNVDTRIIDVVCSSQMLKICILTLYISS